MPKYYSFNSITKALIGNAEAMASPAEVGVFLLPAHATFKNPPAFNPATQSVVFDGLNWNVIPRPVEVIEQTVFGWLATDAEKHATLMRLAKENFMDYAAQSLGFDDITDAVNSAPEGQAANQFERDAKTLKAWRGVVLTTINEWIAKVQGNHNPMPPIKTIMDSMPKLVREFPEPDMTPGKLHGPLSPPKLEHIQTISLNELLGIPSPPEPQFPPLQQPEPEKYPHKAVEPAPPPPVVNPPLPPMDPNLS